jgi:hypothetical protein
VGFLLSLKRVFANRYYRDWKKLTFYYFADAYINFNSLVTDLFKVYKTRIWMSAINPASFASPSLGLQAPSGIGPGAVGVTRNPQPERRQPQAPEPATYRIPPTGRGFSYGQPFVTAEPVPPFQPSGFSYGYSPFAAPRNVGISPAGYVPMDAFGGFPAPNDYQQGLPARFPSPHGSTPNDAGDFSRNSNPMGAPNDAWINNFQGLSMNSR